MNDFGLKTVSAFKWHTFFRLLSQIFTWSITILLVRILKPQDYGLMSMAMITYSFIDLFNGIGLGAAIVQNEVKQLKRRELSTIFWIGIITSLLFYLILFFLTPYISIYFSEERLTRIIRLLGIGFITGSLRIVPFNLLTKNLEFKKRGFTEFIANLSSSLFALIFALKGLGVYSLVFSFLVREIVMTFVTFISEPFFPQFNISFNNTTSLFTYGIKVAVSRILWFFHSNSDYLILGRIMGKINLGYYSVAFQLSSMPVIKINQYIREVTFPVYSHINNNKLMINQYFVKNIRVVSLIMFPVLVGLLIVANDFFNFFLGEQWSNSIQIFKIFCIASLFKSLYSQNAPVLNAIGRPDIDLKYNLLQVIIMPLSFFIAAHSGLLWVAMCWVTIYPIIGIYSLIMVFRLLKLKVLDYIRAIYPPCLSCIIMYSFTSLIKILLENYNVGLRLAIICISGSIIYFLIIFVVSKESILEIKSIIQFARK